MHKKRSCLLLFQSMHSYPWGLPSYSLPPNSLFILIFPKWKNSKWPLFLCKYPCICVCVCVLVSQLCPTLWHHGLWPARLLCPWNSPGKNTGVGGHSLLQGDLPNPGINPRSPALQAGSLPSEPPGKPRKYPCVKVAQLCPTLCDPIDYSPPGSFVHGILQARILE